MKKESEKEIERFLKNKVDKQGGMSIKMLSTINGMPDQLIILPNGSIAFVEVKCKQGRLQPIQKRRIGQLTDLGQKVFVVYSKDEVLELINTLNSQGSFKRKEIT